MNTTEEANKRIEEHLDKINFTFVSYDEGTVNISVDLWHKQSIEHAIITIRREIEVLKDVGCLGENDELKAIEEELNSRLK